MRTSAFSLFQRLRFPAPHRSHRVSCSDGNTGPIETIQNVIERSNVASKQRHEPPASSVRCGARARRSFEFVLEALENVDPDSAFADATKTRRRQKSVVKP